MFDIFFTAVIIVVLQRFAEDPLIVSDLVYLDDAPKGEDGGPREEGTLKMVRRAVWGVLYADDARVVSTSPRGHTRMMDVIVVACMSGFRTDSAGEKYRGHAPVVPSQHSVKRSVKLRRQGNGISRRPSLFTSVVLSARARTLTPRLSVASAPLERVSGNTVPNCTTDGTPGCRSRSGYSTWR